MSTSRAIRRNQANEAYRILISDPGYMFSNVGLPGTYGYSLGSNTPPERIAINTNMLLNSGYGGGNANGPSRPPRPSMRNRFDTVPTGMYRARY